MHTLHISYDLYKADGRDYTKLFDRIKILSTGKYDHPVESTWFVETQYDHQEFLAHLGPVLHYGDKIVITEVDRTAGFWSKGLADQDLDYLKSTLLYVTPFRRPGYIA